MADKIRFTFFHKRVHPFLIILAVVHRAAHALNALGYSLADRNLRLDEADDLLLRATRLAPEVLGARCGRG